MRSIFADKLSFLNQRVPGQFAPRTIMGLSERAQLLHFCVISSVVLNLRYPSDPIPYIMPRHSKGGAKSAGRGRKLVSRLQSQRPVCRAPRSWKSCWPKCLGRTTLSSSTPSCHRFVRIGALCSCCTLAVDHFVVRALPAGGEGVLQRFQAQLRLTVAKGTSRPSPFRSTAR